MNIPNKHITFLLWGIFSISTYLSAQEIGVVNLAKVKSHPLLHTIQHRTNNQVFLVTPDVGDQGDMGSCTAWSLGYANASIVLYDTLYSHDGVAPQWEDVLRSPSYLYNNLQVRKDNSGAAFTRDVALVIHTQGICSYDLMPYTLDTTVRPNQEQQEEAYRCRMTYSRLNDNSDVNEYKEILNSGRPISVLSRTWSKLMNPGSSGIWDSMADLDDTTKHMTCIVGYDDNRQVFKGMNSHGTSYGDNGFYWVTYNLVREGCFEETYVFEDMDIAILPRIHGNSDFCDSTTYHVNSLNGYHVTNWSLEYFGQAPQYHIESHGDYAIYYRTTGGPIPGFGTFSAEEGLSTAVTIPVLPPSITRKKIRAIISNGHSTDTIRKTVEFPSRIAPTLQEYPTTWKKLRHYTLTVNNLSNVPDNDIRWSGVFHSTNGSSTDLDVSTGRTWSVTPTSLGVYEIDVTNTQGCPNESTLHIRTIVTSAFGVQVNSDCVEVAKPADDDNNYEYTLVDIYNQTHHSTSTSDSPIILPSQSLSNGVYMLVITQNNVIIDTYKIIINNK